MKKYVLMVNSICDVGGGQIYAKNKSDFINKKVCNDVYVVSLKRGKSFINGLEKFSNYIIPDLSINPLILSRKKINTIINKLNLMMGGIDDETIIESNTYIMNLWGEILSKKYMCKHYIYIIDENLPKIDKYLIDFFSFKRERNELNGARDETYRMIFGHYSNNDNYNYYLPLVCTNVVENYINEKFNNIEYLDFNISTIGRLDKSYVPTLVNEIAKFANNHSKLNISYVMIGGCKDKKNYLMVKRSFKKIKNIKLFLMGNIYPIPADFLKRIDVFISSAGSVRVSANIGKPTISIDVHDFQSIGIFNYDTVNNVFRYDEPKISISEKLEQLYKDDFYKKIKIKKDNRIDNRIDAILSAHLEQYKNSDNNPEYYDFSNYKLDFKQQVSKIIINITGVKLYRKIYELIKQIRSKRK